MARIPADVQLTNSVPVSQPALTGNPAEPARSLVTTNPSRPESAGRIQSLDGLRGVAILMVLLIHFTPGAPASGSFNYLVSRTTGFGWTGVDLFFVLSGFLITGILYETKRHKGYFRTFYIRRTLRIFPLYYGVLIAFFTLGALLGAERIAGYAELRPNQIWLWLYLTNVKIATANSWTFAHLGLFWTLAIEEQFYIVWPAIIFMLSRRGSMLMCGFLVVQAVILRTVLVWHGYSGSPDMGLPTYVFTFCRIDSLATGAFCALYIRSEPSHAVSVIALNQLARVGRYVFAAAALTIGLIFLSLKGFWWYVAIVQSVGYSVLAAFYCSLLLLAITAKQGTFINQFFTSRFLRWFGTYSYGLYVLHAVFRPLIEFVLPTKFVESHFGWIACYAVNAAVGITISSGLAWLSFHLYEKRFLALKRYFAY
ncbi:acyltransferase [soil metagenome]